MSNLIKALQIFLKYGDPEYPTHCEHDVLYVLGIDPNVVSAADKAELETLGFMVSNEYGDTLVFQSFRYGSA